MSVLNRLSGFEFSPSGFSKWSVLRTVVSTRWLKHEPCSLHTNFLQQTTEKEFLIGENFLPGKCKKKIGFNIWMNFCILIPSTYLLTFQLHKLRVYVVAITGIYNGHTRTIFFLL